MTLSITKEPTQLVNNAGQPVTVFRFGVGWDVGSGGQKGLMGRFNKMKGVDLDASVIMFDDSKQAIRCCNFEDLDPFHGAIRHTGDNKTGKGDGPDESIDVNLNALPAQIHTLVCTLSSYKGATFEKINGASVQIIDMSAGQNVLTEVFVPIDQSYSAAIMAVVRRRPDGTWTIEAMNHYFNGRTWRDLANQVQSLI